MRHFVITSAAAVCAGLALAPPLWAENAVVVELFTSQGCSTCPAADALLHSLSGRDDLIPLALHVDYWDYIGWKDTFAQARFSERQRAYAAALGKKMVYTPQIIVHGREALTASTKAQLTLAIAATDAAPAVDLRVTRDGASLTITAQALNAGPAMVQLVRYRPLEQVTIERGENAGQVITYSNIVTEWTQLGDWNGTGSYEITAPLIGGDKAVVIVQTKGPGPILAAYRVD